MGVLETPDRTWRVEKRPDGLRLYHHNFLVLAGATMDQVVNYMIDAGGDPGQLQER